MRKPGSHERPHGPRIEPFRSLRPRGAPSQFLSTCLWLENYSQAETGFSIGDGLSSHQSGGGIVPPAPEGWRGVECDEGVAYTLKRSIV
jgi:hypothetical protein